MKIQIKNRRDNSVIFEGEYSNIEEAVEEENKAIAYRKKLGEKLYDLERKAEASAKRLKDLNRAYDRIKK